MYAHYIPCPFPFAAGKMVAADILSNLPEAAAFDVGMAARRVRGRLR